MLLSADARLPGLREDLQLYDNSSDLNGVEQWMLFDPVRHAYHEIDRETARLLKAWSGGPAADIIESARAEGLESITLESLSAVFGFLHSNELVQSFDSEMLYNRRLKSRAGWLSRVALGYLFFRVPLVRPQRFFDTTGHLFGFAFHRFFWMFVSMLGCIGIYLVLRQWDEFTNTFMHFFSINGLLAYGLTLLFVKSVHELGHGYAATRYGARVPTMGIAFIVMFPVLYTDNTDSWKLTSRKERLIIDAAGIITELLLAVVATFLWAFMTDGPLRSACFLVATTSWVSTIAVNTNPLMRFDGYYFLMDLTNVRNLQHRSMALGKWRLRELLFRPAKPPPENLPVATTRWLIWYAWCTWVYRFFLFLGIALLVYNFFFKVLGVILFALEISWFIGRPVVREMKEWKTLLSETPPNSRMLTTLILLAALTASLLLPWQRSVTAPVLLEANLHQQIFVEQPGYVSQLTLTDGREVAQGEVLLTLSSPDLQARLTSAELEKTLLQERIDRAVVNLADRHELMVLRQQLAKTSNAIAALTRSQQHLQISAPFDGIIRDINPQLHESRWIGAGFPVAVIVANGPGRARGYVAAGDIDRLEAGTSAEFYTDDSTIMGLPGTLTRVRSTAIEAVDLTPLASIHGGPVAVNDIDGALVPTRAWYPIDLALDPESADVTLAGSAVAQTRTGVVRINAKAESIASRAWQRIVQVGIQEMGL